MQTLQDFKTTVDKITTLCEAVRDILKLHYDEIIPIVTSETREAPCHLSSDELREYIHLSKIADKSLQEIFHMIYAFDHDIELALNWRKHYRKAASNMKAPEPEMTLEQALGVALKNPELIKQLKAIAEQNGK